MFLRNKILAASIAMALILLLVPGLSSAGESELAPPDPANMDLLGSKNPAEELPPGWKILYDEDFEHDNPPGWEMQRDEEVTVEVSWGKLNVTNKQKKEKLFLFNELEIDPLGDYRIEVKLNYDGSSSDRGFGLLWGSKDKENYIELGLTPKREAKLQVIGKGQAQQDKEHALGQYKDALKSGSSSNVLVIHKTVDDVSFMANGEQIFSARALPLFGNKIGFYLDPQAEIDVERLVIAQNSSPMAALTALPFSGFVQKHEVINAQFSPDGRRFMTMSSLYVTDDLLAGHLALLRMYWDATVEDPVPIGSSLHWHPLPLSKFSFSRNGEFFAFANADDTIVVARLVDGKPVIENTIKGFAVKALALSPDGARLSFCEEKKLYIVAVATAEKIASATSKIKKNSFGSAVRFGPSGKYIAVDGYYDMKSDLITSWLFRFDGTILTEVMDDGLSEGLYFDSSSSRVLSFVGIMGHIGAYDLQGKKLDSTYGYKPGHKSLVMNGEGDVIIVMSNGTYVYSISDDDKILPIEEGEAGTGVKAASYDADRGMWNLVAGDSLVRRRRPAAKKIQAYKLYEEGRELLKNGFVKPGGMKLLESVETYPPVNLARLTDLLLAENSIQLSLAGQIFLKQYQLGLNENRVPKLGVVFLNASFMSGRAIKQVLSGSEAQKAGLRYGDIILSVDGKPVSDNADLQSRIEGGAVGGSIMLGLERHGQKREVSLRLEPGLTYSDAALNGIIWYGVSAARAGKSDLTDWSAKEIRRLAAEFPATFNREKLALYATGLEALAMASRGKATDAYDHIIMSGGIISEKHTWLKKTITTSYLGNMFKPLYADKKKLAYILDIKESDLLTPDGQWPMLVSFPDKDGTMIEVAGGAAVNPTASTTEKKSSGGVILLE